MYSTHNEGRSVVAERFIKTLKNKIYKHMTIISKNVYFNILDGIVKDYNNTIHSSIKIKPKDVEENKIGDHVRISKNKNIFSKGYASNWSKEVFVVHKIQNTVSWNYLINDLNGKKIKGSFYEKKLQKTNQKNVEEKK